MLKKVIRYLPFILVIVFLMVTVVYAQGGGTGIIHSCVDKDGKLRIVPATNDCKKKEENLNWNIQGPQGPQGLPGTGGFAQFVVVDSEQREVGVLISEGTVAHYIDPYWVTFPISWNEFPEHNSFSVVYESNDCSGTPFLESYGLFRQGSVAGTTVFYPADPLQMRSFSSYRMTTLGIEPAIQGPCSSFESVTSMSGPIGEFDISEFTPPYSISTKP